MKPNGRSKSEIVKLIRYSESLDAKVAEDSREALRSLIDQGEAINYLVQYYAKSQSSRALDLLCRIREPHDIELCNRMQENMEKNPLATIILLGQIVQKAPSWLAKLADHPLFTSILKQLNTAQSPVIVVSGTLFVSSLLPHCSTLRKSTLHELFRILLSSCSMLYKRIRFYEKGANEYESIYISHLYCALTQYFVILYGIYPSSLISYLRNHFSNSVEMRHSYLVLEPILSAVKLHPQLIKMNEDQETERQRWSHREAHDFVADCRRILVRPTTVSADSRGYVTIMQPRSNKSQSIARTSMMRDFVAALPSNHSTSSVSLNRTERGSSDSTSDDLWSPSVQLGLDTPPDSRVTTPVNQRFLGSSSRRSTGSDDMRSRRPHLSMSQKFNDFLRKRQTFGGRSPTMRSVELGDLHDLRSTVSLDKSFPATKEEVEDIEIISPESTGPRRESEASQVEEGVDAGEEGVASNTALSVHQEESQEEIPLQIGRELPRRSSSGSKRSTYAYDWAAVDSTKDTATTNLSHSTLVGSAEITKHSSLRRKPSSETDSQHAQDQFLSDLDNQTGAVVFNGISGVTGSHTGSQYSVSSFFKTLNRQRFYSECRPMNTVFTKRSSANIADRSFPKLREQCNSCPDLVQGIRNYECVQEDLLGNGGKTGANVTMTDADLSEFIEKQFPYLIFLKTLPLMDVDDNLLERELKAEHDRSFKRYMEASCEHHSLLKQLGLADRLPSKIYDDMSTILHGLSTEKQRDVLSSRLVLVNQHLLYERCGRLLHAERNRRLFGRIKQQKLSDADKVSLKKKLHDADERCSLLRNFLSDKRRELIDEKRKRTEIEHMFSEKLKEARAECDKLATKLDSVVRQYASLKESSDLMAMEVASVKRRCENAEVELSFAQTKNAELENLRPELQKANSSNQMLKDQIKLYEERDKRTKSVKIESSNGRDEIFLSSQNEQLRIDLKKERNMKESLLTKLNEVSNRLKEEIQRNNDLKALIERSALVHRQQSEAAQHKFLSLLSICQKQQSHILDLNTLIEKLDRDRKTSTAFREPVIIPRSNIPEEILSCESSACGSETATFFPSDCFLSSNAEPRSGDFKETQTISNRSLSDRDSFPQSQSGTL
ncbi:hypothetical protein AB6A40_004273 [Gnathostoma spinigerum]|uniref:Hamartin n=1 Tax=Gnathostoma spinigerum TaxID=75299 RepID=A0ABD6EBZ4_9BILA